MSPRFTLFRAILWAPITTTQWKRPARTGNKFVCLPDKLPTRNEVIDMFVKWAKAHPQYMKEIPVETIFRFLAEKWPCK